MRIGVVMFFIAALLGFSVLTGGFEMFAQIPAHNCVVYEGYLSGNMEAWKKGIAEQEKKYRVSGSSNDLFVLILSKYGYIAYLINLKKDAEVKMLIASAEEDIARLGKDTRYYASASALRGALIAMKISLNPLKATYLGMRSLRFIEESLNIDDTDPAGWVEMGNARYHMPSVVGGSFKEAARCFTEAVRLFEAEVAGAECNWHYLHALVWLAKSYEGLDELTMAKTIYEKLLTIEPEFIWVSKELYPDLLKRMSY